METGVAIYKPNSAVIARREMAKMPAVMNALGPVDRSVFLASSAKTIGEYDNVELAKELSKALKYIAKDVGYRMSDESELGYLVVRICEILKRYYFLLTLRDFRMAFEMSITGELDDYLPKNRDGNADRGHYQQFNAEYICKILNAYKLRRDEVLQQAQNAMPVSEPVVDQQQAVKWRNLTKRELIEAYEYYKEKHTLPEITTISEMLFYNLLSSVGLAGEIVVTLEDRTAIFEQTRTDLARRGMFGDFVRVKKSGVESSELQNGAYMRARRKALESTFEHMVENGIIITDYIKFED